MTPETIMTMGNQAIKVALLLGAPLLLVALVIGLVISIFQAITQIHEATLSFVPKLIAALLVLALAGPWMLTTLVDYIRRKIEMIPQLPQ